MWNKVLTMNGMEMNKTKMKVVMVVSEHTMTYKYDWTNNRQSRSVGFSMWGLY